MNLPGASDMAAHRRRTERAGRDRTRRGSKGDTDLSPFSAFARDTAGTARGPAGPTRSMARGYIIKNDVWLSAVMSVRSKRNKFPQA